MKTLSMLALLATALPLFMPSACKDGGDVGKFDPYAKIWINVKDLSNKAQTTQQRFTAEQKCKGDSIVLMGTYKPNNSRSATIYQIKPTSGGFLPIDTINMRIAMEAGNADDGFTPLDKNILLREGHNWYIQKFDRDWETDPTGEKFNWIWGDTICYIPTAVRLAAREELRKLWDDRDANREAIYKIFNETFVFYPCTGAEYKRMLEEWIE